jgi:hypothetical protein
VPLTKRHLTRLSRLAEEDREQFYIAQPEYRHRLIATVLAQGAALHYLDRKNGVKDLDVWSFFTLPAGHTRFPADRRHRHVDFGPSDLGRQRYDLARAKNAHERSQWQRWQREHQGRRVDLLMRGLRCDLDEDPAAAVRGWIDRGLRRSAKSPWHLRQSAVILIDPKHRRGEVIWDPR